MYTYSCIHTYHVNSPYQHATIYTPPRVNSACIFVHIDMSACNTRCAYVQMYIHTETTCLRVYIYIYLHQVYRCVYADFTCMCVCIDIHVRHIHMCVCIYLHICTCAYKCMHTCLCLYMCVWVYICMHICM